MPESRIGHLYVIVIHIYKYIYTHDYKHMSALYFETETRRLARISAMATPHPTQRTTQVPTMA